MRSFLYLNYCLKIRWYHERPRPYPFHPMKWSGTRFFWRINLWHYHGNEDSKNFKLHDRGGKNWLSIDGYKDNFGNIDRNLFQVEEA